MPPDGQPAERPSSLREGTVNVSLFREPDRMKPETFHDVPGQYHGNPNVRRYQVTATFISPYDDFEHFLWEETGGADAALVIPVLLGLTAQGRHRFSVLSDILLSSDDDTRRRDALSEIDAFIDGAGRFLAQREGRAFSPELDVFLDHLQNGLASGSGSVTAFLGRIVAFVPGVEEIDQIESSMLLKPHDQSGDVIPVFQPLWVGPVMALDAPERAAPASFIAPAIKADLKIGKPVIGIIDDAIGFLNQSFQNGNQSRFDAIWLQKRPTRVRHGLDLGPELQGSQTIDSLLVDIQQQGGRRHVVEARKYKAINSTVYGVDFFKGTDHDKTHGTHMLGLALGEDDPNLDATERDILAVQLPPFALRDMTGHYLSFFAFLGLRWMLRRMVFSNDLAAMTEDTVRPLILNISLGNLAGPKDGSGNFEREFSREVDLYEDATGGRVSAFFSYGNYYGEHQVAVATVKPGETATLSWQLQSNDPTASFIELRSDAEFEVSVKRYTWDAQTDAMRPRPGQFENLIKNTSKIVGRVYGNVSRMYQHHPDSDTLIEKDDGIVVALRPTTGPGKGNDGYWHIILHGVSETATVTCQIQSGGTPPEYLGYTVHGLQSKLEQPQFDTAVRATNEGCYSALVPGLDPRHYSVGAAAFVEPDQRPKPMFYSSEGGLFPSSAAPAMSAVVQSNTETHGLPGLGTLSETFAKIGGSSAASAVAARAFVLDVRQVIGETYAHYPLATRVSPGADARLGSRTI